MSTLLTEAKAAAPHCHLVPRLDAPATQSACSLPPQQWRRECQPARQGRRRCEAKGDGLLTGATSSTPIGSSRRSHCQTPSKESFGATREMNVLHRNAIVFIHRSPEA